jgi:hypothetical protein
MTKNLAYDLAKILTEYSSPVQPGEYVTIVGNSTTGAPLIGALGSGKRSPRSGARCAQRIAGGGAHRTGYRSDYFELCLRGVTPMSSLIGMDSTIMHWVNQSDALFFVQRRQLPGALSSVDPARVAHWLKTLSNHFSTRYLERYAAKELRRTRHWAGRHPPPPSLRNGIGAITRSLCTGRAAWIRPDPVKHAGANFAHDARSGWSRGWQAKAMPRSRAGIYLSFDFEARPGSVVTVS